MGFPVFSICDFGATAAFAVDPADGGGFRSRAPHASCIVANPAQAEALARSSSARASNHQARLILLTGSVKARRNAAHGQASCRSQRRGRWAVGRCLHTALRTSAMRLPHMERGDVTRAGKMRHCSCRRPVHRRAARSRPADEMKMPISSVQSRARVSIRREHPGPRYAPLMGPANVENSASPAGGLDFVVPRRTVRNMCKPGSGGPGPRLASKVWAAKFCRPRRSSAVREPLDELLEQLARAPCRSPEGSPDGPAMLSAS